MNVWDERKKFPQRKGSLYVGKRVGGQLWAKGVGVVCSRPLIDGCSMGSHLVRASNRHSVSNSIWSLLCPCLSIIPKISIFSSSFLDAVSKIPPQIPGPPSSDHKTWMNHRACSPTISVLLQPKVDAFWLQLNEFSVYGYWEPHICLSAWLPIEPVKLSTAAQERHLDPSVGDLENPQKATRGKERSKRT